MQVLILGIFFLIHQKMKQWLPFLIFGVAFFGFFSEECFSLYRPVLIELATLNNDDALSVKID